MKKLDKKDLYDKTEREGKEINVPRVIIAFIISLSVLVFVFLAGYMVSFLNYQKVSSIQDTLKTDLLNTQLSGEFLLNCNEDAFNVFSEELDRTGSLLSILETRFGKNDENVIEQKKTYTLIEIQHFIIVKEYSEKCNKDMDTILFFYSNSDEYENRAEEIGKILGSVKEDNQNLMIYSFDYDLDLGIIELLKKSYEISGPNTAVLNEKIHIENIENSRDILRFL